MVMRRQPTGDELDRMIREMHADGALPTDMSHRFGVRVVLIRERMAALDLEEDRGARVGRAVHPMWDADEDKRRDAIRRRAAQSAAQQRRHNEGENA